MRTRGYQETTIDQLNQKLMVHDKAFLNMPTGTGKTLVALCFIERFFGNAKIAWAAHQIGLKDQAQGEYRAFDCKADISFYTWQSLRNSDRKFDLLIIDEAHYGSSRGNTTKHKSFLKIMSLAQKVLFVSATPWNLDPEVYQDMLNQDGKIDYPKYSVVYSLREAIQDGYVSPVDIRVIDTVDYIKLSNLEEMKGPQGSLVKNVINRKVNVKNPRSLKQLKRSLLCTMLDAYFMNEETKDLEPTIIFCENGNGILSHRNVMKEFQNKLLEYRPKSKQVDAIDFVDANNKFDQNGRAKLKKFKQGSIKVLCVKGMCREGFDYPELKIAIDLVPSNYNKRLMFQKYGRLSRLVDGRQIMGRYYYPNKFQDHIKHKGVTKCLGERLKKEIGEAVQSNGYDQEAIERAVATTYGMFNRAYADDQEGLEMNITDQRIYTAKGLDRKQTIHVSKIRLGLTIEEARNGTLKHKSIMIFSRDLETMPGSRDPDGKNAKLLEWAKAGKKRPNAISGNREEAILGITLQNRITRKDSIIEFLPHEWFGLKKPHGYWRDNKSLVFKEAQKYPNLKEWEKNDGASYFAAYDNGWLPDIRSKVFPDAIKPKGYWKDNKELVFKEAQKYPNLKEWRKK